MIMPAIGRIDWHDHAHERTLTCRDEVRRDGTAHATGLGKEANLLLAAEPIVASARVACALLAHA
jgi:hypothetical protein